MAVTSTMLPLGTEAPDFSLPDVVTGETVSRDDFGDARALLVMFICNHCPYVKAVLDRIVRDCSELATQGIGSIAIMSNDPAAYAEDSFDNMQRVAREKKFPFPYVFDETQAVAKAYDAQCTPEFFGFNAKLELQYRGRLDASRTSPVPNARRDLYEAMLQVARSGEGPKDQVASIGCSIKWKS